MADRESYGKNEDDHFWDIWLVAKSWHSLLSRLHNGLSLPLTGVISKQVCVKKRSMQMVTDSLHRRKAVIRDCFMLLRMKYVQGIVEEGVSSLNQVKNESICDEFLQRTGSLSFS